MSMNFSSLFGVQPLYSGRNCVSYHLPLILIQLYIYFQGKESFHGSDTFLPYIFLMPLEGTGGPCPYPAHARSPSAYRGNGDTFLLKPRLSGSLGPPGSFQGIKRLPCLVQQILFMSFLLIIPVRILLYPSFFAILTFVITDIPELRCCIAHMPDEVRIFPADLYGYFL